MENKKIIIILIVIIAVMGLAAVMLSSSMNKMDSNLAITHKSINVGDSVSAKLSDSNGNPISDQMVKMKLTDKNGKTIDNDVKTNSKGRAKLKVDNEGVYAVECKFNGNDKYSATSVDANISVVKAKTKLVDDNQTSSSKSNSESGGGSSDYPKYNPAIGSYRTVESQQELALIETSSGQNYVLAGDGYYIYGGHDSQGNIKLGSYVGKY